MPDLNRWIAPPARAVIERLSKRSLPQLDGYLNLPGLKESVEVLRDRWGVPHIYANNEHDLYFAQGFVHAQDRLFQMELNRRTGHGRLSELVGEAALDTDRAVRAFGFPRLAGADWEAAPPELRETLQAYAAGVNAFLKSPTGKLPVEFTLLNFHPEPWTPLDSLAFSRVMIWQLSHAWFGEVIRAGLIEAVGAERAAELEIHYPTGNPASLPQGIEFNRLDPDGKLTALTGPFLDRGKGSNAWVVSPTRSATGSAVLCNDMHLKLSLPSLWYEAHLTGGDLQVSGVGLPGLPMILVGHNARIAWGMTLAFTDAEDLFVEQFDPTDRLRYQAGQEWLKAEVIEERIEVKGRKQAHIERVVVTRHGPVISDVIGAPAKRLAVQSMALRPCPAVQGWWMLNRAGNWDEFVAAMQKIEAPQLNVAYADVDDNIGYWVTGKVPVRAAGDGSVPAPGWSDDHEWIGEVPFAEMPHALNPQRGFLVTCNHKIIDDDYPHFLGNVWMNGYRAKRLEQLFTAKDKLEFGDYQAAHLDFICYPGREFAARVDDLETRDADAQQAILLLRNWDGALSPDSVGGAVYEVARYLLARAIFEPALGKDLTNRYMGDGFNPVLYASHEFYGHDTVVLLRLLDNPTSWWMENAGGLHKTLETSLGEAVRFLRARFGADPLEWQWGRLHRVSFDHPLGIQKPLDRVFNRGPYPIGGDTDTVCQTAILASDPYDNKAWAPSFRMIADLGNLDNSLASYSPGQSARLGSPHYDDLIDPWLKGEYHPMLWSRPQVEAGAIHRLILTL
jgi:penicillin amidase